MEETTFSERNLSNDLSFFENAYISQRTRNTVQDHLKNETIISGELGYKLNAPALRLGITGYYTKFRNGVDVLTFTTTSTRILLTMH